MILVPWVKLKPFVGKFFVGPSYFYNCIRTVKNLVSALYSQNTIPAVRIDLLDKMGISVMHALNKLPMTHVNGNSAGT